MLLVRTPWTRTWSGGDLRTCERIELHPLLLRWRVGYKITPRVHLRWRAHWSRSVVHLVHVRTTSTEGSSLRRAAVSAACTASSSIFSIVSRRSVVIRLSVIVIISRTIKSAGAVLSLEVRRAVIAVGRRAVVAEASVLVLVSVVHRTVLS